MYVMYFWGIRMNLKNVNIKYSLSSSVMPIMCRKKVRCACCLPVLHLCQQVLKCYPECSSSLSGPVWSRHLRQRRVFEHRNQRSTLSNYLKKKTQKSDRSLWFIGVWFFSSHTHLVPCHSLESSHVLLSLLCNTNNEHQCVLLNVSVPSQRQCLAAQSSAKDRLVCRCLSIL